MNNLFQIKKENLSRIADIKDIIDIHNTINKNEDKIKIYIENRISELNNLEIEANNIYDTYSNIIKSLIKVKKIEK